MANLLKLRVELSDGCILVGEVISVGSKPQSPEYFDKPQMKWFMDLLTDTLGKVEINAAHIVRIGPCQTEMRQFKEPVEVVNYVLGLMVVSRNFVDEKNKSN